MRKLLITFILAVALLVLPVSVALAETSQDVTVTATPSYVSITNSPATYDFGLVVTSSTDNTGADYFTVTNDSSVNITVTIGCDGWSGGGSPWTYGASDNNTGQLRASDGDVAYDVTVPKDSSTSLHATSTVGANFSWELLLEAPSIFLAADEQTTIVTLTAAKT